jgi:uncharacterized membrane protein
MTAQDPLGRLLRRRASHTGLVMAAAATPYTFQRTLVTRSNADQAIVTGLSFLLHQATASAIQESLQGVARPAGAAIETDAGMASWSRRSIAVDLIAVAAGIGLQRALIQKDREPLMRAVGRTAGWLTAAAAAGGALVGVGHEAAAATRPHGRFTGLGAVALTAGGLAGLREFNRRRAEDLDAGLALESSNISAGRSLALAASVTVGSGLVGHAEGLLAERVAMLAARVLPGDADRWRPLGHLATLAAVGWGGRVASSRIAGMIEGREKRMEPALDVPPLSAELSGGPDSLIPYNTMSRMGRRFVWTVRRPPEIERVMGEPAIAHPIRAFVSLQAAPSQEERVSLAIQELERAGGFERSWLMVASPTGTGYVNYAAAGALEFLTKGDCATLAMQYSQRPSPLSLDRVSHGRSQFSKLISALSEKLQALPSDKRPRVVMFGESLGAWTSQDAFLGAGTRGLESAGIDYAIWIGTPFGSEWKDQVLDGSSPDVDSSLIGVFDSIDDLTALDADARNKLQYVMITHTNDGVALFGAQLLVQQPNWLGAAETRPRKIPRSQKWTPITSFVQTMIDTKNAARVVPGKFDAEGHDYRADIVPFFDAVLGFNQPADQLVRMAQALEEEEAFRTAWIADHGEVGKSMASVVLSEVRESHPDVFLEAVYAIRQKRAQSASDGS